MDFPTFREHFDALPLLAERAAKLLEFAEDSMQSSPGELLPLIRQTRLDCMADGLELEAAMLDRLLGWMAFDQSDYAEALGYFEDALALFERTANHPGRVKALNGIGCVSLEQGKLESALAFFRKGLALAEEVGEVKQTLVLKANIGGTLSRLHQYQEAEPYLRAGLAPQLLSPFNESMVLTQLARVLIPQGKGAEARGVLLRAVHLARTGGHLSALGTALDSLGALDLREGHTEQTHALLSEARTVARQAGAKSTEAQATLDLGRLRMAHGDPAEALVLFRDALALTRAIGTTLLEAEVWKETAAARKALKHWQEAMEAQERYQELTDRLHEEHVSRQVAQLRATQVQRESDLLKEQTRVLTLLGELGQKITAQLDLEAVVLAVYESIGGLMKTDAFGLGLYDREREVIHYRLFIENGARLAAFEEPVEDSASGRCLRERRALLEGDAARKFRSGLFAPLMAEGEVLGVLSAQSLEPRVYNERHLATFQTLAASIAIAVQNARLFEQVTLLATVDALTGAATRRQLFLRTEQEFQRFLRDGQPLSLVMIDLDNFKTMNDNWGHAVGDTLLAEFGALCLRHKRPHDLFGRYGGEEFALVLAGTTLEGAVRSAQRLCSELASLALSAPAGDAIRLTASFGVTAFDARDADISKVFSRADAALYDAKQGGRNQVVYRQP